MFSEAEKYIKNRSADLVKWHLENINRDDYDIIFIIPCYAENPTIIETIKSINIQVNIKDYNVLAIVVINNESNPQLSTYYNNIETSFGIKKLRFSIDIGLIDCYTERNRIEDKKFGVGYVRKIGLDNAILHSSRKTILCWLDADTTLEKTYINNLINCYNEKKCSSLITNFKHRKNDNLLVNESIVSYERVLKFMAMKLSQCGSIYKYIPLGPTITCLATTYVHLGGLTPKKATEDFYFLQELCKYGNIDFAEDIFVYPSSRVSQRVYLGTGYRMKKALEGEDINGLYYSSLSYEVLSKLLILIVESYNMDYENIIDSIDDIDPNLLKFLNKEGFKDKWSKINNSSPTKEHFKIQFQRYFDWLKTIKLLKYYS